MPLMSTSVPVVPSHQSLCFLGAVADVFTSRDKKDTFFYYCGCLFGHNNNPTLGNHF